MFSTSIVKSLPSLCSSIAIGSRSTSWSGSSVTRAQYTRTRHGFFKIVFDPATRKVLGVHVVSRGASDIVGGLAVALKLGATIDDLALVHHVYPSYSEGVKAAAEQALTKVVAA